MRAPFLSGAYYALNLSELFFSRISWNDLLWSIDLLRFRLEKLIDIDFLVFSSDSIALTKSS